MTIYISCHGEKQPTMPDTFVPRYTPRIMFYAKADENLFAANELGALARADLGIGDPTDVYAAGSTIPNYILTPDNSQEAALATFFEPSGGTLYLIPQQMALCMFDGKDDTGAFRPCDETEGVHYCTGLLGSKAWSDSELQGDIVMLSCRGISGRKNSLTRPLGGDEHTMDAVSAFLERFTAADEDGKVAMWDDPELPEGTKVTMLTMRPIAEWVQVRQARGVAAAYGDLAVTSYVASPDNQSSKAAMERDPEIAAALARAQQQVAAFLAADDGTRGSIWSAMSAADRDYLSYRDPQIAAWAQTQAPPDIQAQPATEQPAGQDALDDVDLILDDWTMQAIALQGAWSATDQQIASFTGTEVDASEVEMLEMTWEMSLSDLDALRTAAGEDANRQQLATGLLESGTVFGQALTAYKDAVGEHTLKELQSAGQTFGQWVSSLA